MKRTSALVDYPSSDGEDGGKEAPVTPNPRKKRKQLPSLASTLALPTPIDNPALHQGRVRSSPHVEGQFVAYVYIPLKLVTTGLLYSLLHKVVSRAQQFVPIIHPIGITREFSVVTTESEMELHISLTKAIYLRAHQREELKFALKGIAKGHSRFGASFATLAELSNDERTRTFLTLEIGAGHAECKALCDAMTPILRTYRQKEFYSEPRFHASIAWALLSKTIEKHEAAFSDGRSRSVASDHSVADEASTTTPPEHTPAEYPTIPHFPQDLVATLVAEFGETLRSKNVGAFECQHLCVRIGKEVTQWELAG